MPYAKMAEVPELRKLWLTDDKGNGRYLLSNNKKSLTLSSWIAQIYTAFCWDALFAHRDLDEAERFLQRALALHPSSRTRYLGILGLSGCARESPNRSLPHWTRQSVDLFDGI